VQINTYQTRNVPVLIVARETVMAAVQGVPAVPAAPGWSVMTVGMTVAMRIWPRRWCDGRAWPALSSG